MSGKRTCLHFRQGRWKLINRDSDGTVRLMVGVDGTERAVYESAGRLAAWIMFGPPGAGEEVAHFGPCEGNQGKRKDYCALHVRYESSWRKHEHAGSVVCDCVHISVTFQAAVCQSLQNVECSGGYSI